MRFITLASTALFGALAAASPVDRRSTENLSITEFTVRETGETVNAVSFELTGGVVCSATDPTTEVYTCGDSLYRFALNTTASPDFGITIYHQTSVAAGLWGKTTISTNCRAGGNGADDNVCNQVSNVFIQLSSDGYGN